MHSTFGGGRFWIIWRGKIFRVIEKLSSPWDLFGKRGRKWNRVFKLGGDEHGCRGVTTAAHCGKWGTTMTTSTTLRRDGPVGWNLYPTPYQQR